MSTESLARELIELQEEAKRLRDAGDIEGWLKSMPAELRAAQRLHSHLLDYPVVVTDDPAVKQLLKDIDLADFVDPTNVGFRMLLSEISPSGYAASIAEVALLISPFQIPANLQQFLDEARQCYALGQYAAVQSLSRTILEAAVNDIAVRSGKMSIQVIEKDMFKEYPPWKRIKLVSGDMFEIINDHYRDLCKVVHGLKTSTSQGPLGSLTKTIGFVQELYELNKQQIRNGL